MASFDDEQDFGLSSSDEADLLRLEPANKENIKRKAEAELQNDSKKPRSEPASSVAVTVANRVLNDRFNIPCFRLKQEAAIARILDGESSVVVFPTGGGKSLSYQVPALCFKEMDRLAGVRQGHAEGGITLVVSPLIALMKDQVDALQRKGISAAVLDSTKSKEEYLRTVASMRDGTLDILYCAPERLNNEGFVASMTNVKGGVRLLAVDEAHCISEWGHAFRPDYLKVARFGREIQAERFVCLTATATQAVAKDICKAFDIPEDGLFRTSTYRSNLKLRAQSYQTKKESYPQLITALKSFPGSTIIYVTTQKQTEELAEQLRKQRLRAQSFHAGMKPEEKIKVQEEFMASNDLIICATIAFGMGIDKANLRNVFHYDIPRSLEGYSQEIGRAGRDGLDSQCILFLCAEDLHLRERFARGDMASKKSVRSLLEEVFAMRPTNDPVPVIEATLSSLSKEHDINPNTLGSIFAQLELHFGLLRATTPKYTKYQYKLIRSTEGDKTAAGIALRKASRPAKTWIHVDVETASYNSGVPRSELVTKLNDWNDGRLIELQALGVVNIFRVTKEKWPPSRSEAEKIIDAVYKDLEVREQRALDKMQQVIDLVTGEACFAHTLAQHFGDTLPDGSKECGNCTWCKTKVAVPMAKPPKRPWDYKAFGEILQICIDRDDPRYLAKIAFGISSPRITANKLSRHHIFESMGDHEFMTLYRAFEKVCDK